MISFEEHYPIPIIARTLKKPYEQGDNNLDMQIIDKRSIKETVLFKEIRNYRRSICKTKNNP